MYTMIPFNHRNVLNRASELFDDRFFRSFFNMNDWMGSAGFRVDIRENDENYILEAELPGVSEDRISLTCENNTLTIGADYSEEKKDEKTCYSERRTGHLERSFSLEGVMQDQISAEYKNGILYVTLPKEQPARQPGRRQIPIGKAGGDDTAKIDG